MAATATAADPSIEAKWMYQVRKLKDALAQMTQQRDAARSEADESKKRTETAEKKADNSAAHKRVAELEQQLRTLNHKGTFAKLAKARGASDEAIDDLWTLSGWQATGDEIDEAEMGAVLDQQKAHPARAKLFGVIDKANGDIKPTPIVKPAVAGGKGGVHDQRNVSFELEPDDPRWSDAAFMMTHGEDVSKAMAEKHRRGEFGSGGQLG